MRIHIKRKTRTTANIPGELACLLAIHLGAKPGTADARAAIQRWAQSEIDGEIDQKRRRLSDWLAGLAVLAIVRPELKIAWYKCIEKMTPDTLVSVLK